MVMRRMFLFSGIVVLSCGCEIEPATPSDSIVVPYQFNIEFSIEDEGDGDYTARARLYDIAQAYDVMGNAGTIELTGGDEVWAAGIHLDIETRSTFLRTLRVDYSQSIPTGEQSYLFELRRPGDERIEARVPIPPPFEVAEVGEIAQRGSVLLEWEPVVAGATVDITILPLEEGCLTVVGGGAGDIVRGMEDTGEYRFRTDLYHSPNHDCAYELIFSRRSVSTVPGRWIVDGRELPANSVHAIGVRTVGRGFIAAQR